MKKLAVFGAGLAAATTGFSGADQAAAEGGDEAQKQAARLISQAITERISARTDLSNVADDDAERALWAISSYSTLGAGEGMKAQLAGLGDGSDVTFDMDLGLFSGGYDGRTGERTIFGVNVSGYAITGETGIESDIMESETAMTGYGFSAAPYVALKVNNNFFISSVVGFNLSSTTADTASTTTIPGFGTFSNFNSFTTNSTGMFADVSANLVQKLGPVTLREKALYRTSYSISDVEDAEAVMSSAIGLAAEAEVSMGRAAAFYLNAETNYQTDDDIEEARYPVYVGAGLTIRPSSNVQFSAGYQTEFGDDYSDISSFLLQGRIKFGGGGSARRRSDSELAGSFPTPMAQPLAADDGSMDNAASQPMRSATPPAYQYALAAPLPADPAPAAESVPNPYYQAPAAQPLAQPNPYYQQQTAAQPAAAPNPYYQYQQQTAAAYQAPAVLTLADNGARLQMCRLERDQRLAQRERSDDPAVDAYTFRMIYDDYERCAAS